MTQLECDRKFESELLRLHHQYPNAKFDDDVAYMAYSLVRSVDTVISEMECCLKYESGIESRMKSVTSIMNAILDGDDADYMTKEFVLEQIAYIYNLDLENYNDKEIALYYFEKHTKSKL